MLESKGKINVWKNKTLTPSWKKAVVTLKLGDSISLYEGA